MARINVTAWTQWGRLILGVFALLLTAGYHLVSLFVQLIANEYSARFWDSHF